MDKYSFAPYNFIPFPEVKVPKPYASKEELPRHDEHDKESFSGRISSAALARRITPTWLLPVEENRILALLLLMLSPYRLRNWVAMAVEVPVPV